MLIWLLVCFVWVATVAWMAAKLAPRLGLLAYPGEHRRHSEPTPMVGGIAIMAGLLVFAWSVQAELMPALILIFAVGVLDDRFSLPSWMRFIAQALAIWLMIDLTGVELHNLGELLSEREVQLGWAAVPLTIFAGIGVINAINMSDGLDGLAGSLVAIALVALIYLVGSTEPFMFFVLVAVLAFLCFNLRIGRNRAALFMGDSGSTTLGLILTFLLIKYSQQPTAAFAPVTALWLLALPLLDAVAVLLIRPLRGSSPFSADHLHYHHLLLDRGLGVNQALVLVVGIQASLIALGLVMHEFGVQDTLQLLLFLLLFGAYLSYVGLTTRQT